MRIPASIFLLACFCSVSGRAQSRISVGTDIMTGLTSGTIQIHGSYGFHHNWSAAIEAGVNVTAMHEAEDVLSKEHREALGKDMTEESDGFRRDFTTLSLHIDYWTQNTHRGLCFSMGGHLRDRSGPDLTIGMGYYIPIWRGLGINLRYQIGIIETYKNAKLPVDGIRGGLHYVF